MTDLNKLRNEAYRLAQKSYMPGNPKHLECSPIYLAPTGNVVDTMNLYKQAKKVLVVGGMGALGFEAALNGATKVDMFDINELQRLFFEIIKTTVTHFDYPTFIQHFTLKNQENYMQREWLNDFLPNEFYFELAPYLSDEVNSVFTPLYSCFDSKKLLLSSLYRFEYIFRTSYLKEFASLYREEEYYKIQHLLRTNSCAMTYQSLSLTDLPKVIKEKYDLIVLDNILQYYKDIAGLSTPYDVHLFLHKKLSQLVTEDGVIQASYGFQVATDALKDAFHIPYEPYGKTLMERFIAQKTLLMTQKEDINIALAKKEDFYSYDFIPGVEKDTANCENVIVTYHKRSRVLK